jgi:1,4-dihydroxy-2-naphthoyl-CoA synthase
MWFLARFYTASEADKMGLINIVVPVSSFPVKENLNIVEVQHHHLNSKMLSLSHEL